MSVTVKGLNKVLMDLEKRLGTKFSDKVAAEALTKGAQVVADNLYNEFTDFKKTGASRDEITVGPFENIRGLRRVRIHWKGDKERYRVIHLNEWGTPQQPRPKGFGAVARSMDNSRTSYLKVTRKALEKYL